MLPADYLGKSVSEVYMNDKKTNFSLKSVKGITYVFMSMNGGKNNKFTAVYN
jgi:hypothetical protein